MTAHIQDSYIQFEYHSRLIRKEKSLIYINIPLCMYHCVPHIFYITYQKPQKNLSSGIYTGTSVHERLCSRTIRFTNKFSEQKTSRMTNGVSDYEHASRQQLLATS